MNLNTRPDPDQLLASIQQEEATAARGKLKIFFGAYAGAGKTYAMLLAARRQQELGTEVVVGVIETHGRKETATLVEGMERLPHHQLPYRGKLLEEFNLDAALARHPALILMDELAHSNVTGSRHPKRWQDVHELLEAGINVYTTVNVQHLETLNDVISGITSIKVWETVPDHVFDRADEVVLVDLPPDELLQRLHEGKVYMPQQAEQAVANFFRKGNLLALRELALRRTADRVDDSLLAYRRQSTVERVWQTRDALLVCIGGGAAAERLVRTAARLAGRLEARMYALHVETSVNRNERPHILRSLELASTLGAHTTTLTADDSVSAVVAYARSHNLSWVLVGRNHAQSWWPWYRSFADRVGQVAPDLDIVQVAQSAAVRIIPTNKSFIAVTSIDWAAYVKSGLICGGAVALTLPLFGVVELTNIAMLLLLAVLLVAVKLGRGPAVAAAFFVVAAFDFFFVPPRFSFTVSDAEYLITFSVMLIVGLLTGQLTAKYKQHSSMATQRAARARALYEMARDLSAALLPMQVADTCERFLKAEFAAQSRLLLADLEGNLNIIPVAQGINVDEGVSRWVFDHGEAAGLFTATLPGSSLLYLPLKAPMRTRGVLAVSPLEPLRIQGPEARCQLETFANLVAIAVERMHFVEVAQNTLVQMEAESVRNALLAEIAQSSKSIN